MKIFDFHLHPHYDFHNISISDEDFAATLQKSGVGGFGGSVIHEGDCNHPVEEYAEIIPRLNAEAFEIHEKYPDVYVPGIHIHPDHKELSCAEIEKYADKGVRLIGELVHYLMGWTGHDRRELIEILRVASDRKMTLSFHPSRNTAAMETLISSLPDMNIVIAHLDGYGLYDWSVEMMKKYKNVYFDISAHGAERVGMLSDTVNAVGAERILYGTDFPGYSSEKFINYVLSERISDSDREAIFYKNAERLLRLG